LIGGSQVLSFCDQQIPLLSLDFVSAQQDSQHTTVLFFFKLLVRSAVCLPPDFVCAGSRPKLIFPLPCVWWSSFFCTRGKTAVAISS
jgi:hypothetical protein